MKGDTEDYGLRAGFLWKFLRQISAWEAKHVSLTKKHHCWLKKVLWITTFQLSPLMPLYYSGDKLRTLWCVQGGGGGMFLPALQPLKPNTSTTAQTYNNVQRSRASNKITDFTNSAEGKSETLFHCRKDREQTHTSPPETSTSSITRCWFYKASAIRDLIWLYYSGH